MLARLALLFVLIGVACAPPAFNAVDITGADYARDFALADHNGVRRTLADFRGKVVVVFFGFTQCPDVCPTTMADMAQVRKSLGPAGEQVQVIFVSVDPERDTPRLLAQYVPGFDPSFIGLVGTPEEIAKTAKEFKVFYQRVDGKTPTSYSINHSAGSYVFDKKGQVRLFVKHQATPESIAADLKKLL